MSHDGTSPNGTPDELGALVRRLTETQQRIEELTGGAVDALVTAEGESLLLPNAQNFLRSTSQHFRRMFRDSEIGFVTLDAAGRILEANIAFCRMADVSAADARGRSFASLTATEERDGWNDRVQTLASGEQRGFVREQRLVTHGDRAAWVRVSASGQYDGQGALVGLHVIVEDITQQRRAEAGLAAARQQNEFILDAVAEGVHGIDLDGLIVFQNRAALAMLGWSGNETRGRPSHALVHHHRPDGSHYPRNECPIYRTLADGQPRGGDDEWFFRKDGSIFPVEYRVAPVLDTAGRVGGAVVTFSDITRRRRFELVRDAETEILDMISVGESVDAVLAKLAVAVEQALPDVRVSILLVDAAEGCLRAGAAPSLPDAYVRSVDGLPIGPDIGSCGTAVYRREQVIVSDIATDPLWEAGREAALAHGLRACWSTPALDASGEPLASFALYYPEIHEPGDDERELVKRATQLLGLAIERGGQIAALRESEARYRSTVELVPVAIWKEDWSSVVALLRNARAAGAGNMRAYLRANPELIDAAWQSIQITDCNEATLRIFGARDVHDIGALLHRAVMTQEGRKGFVNALAALDDGRHTLESEATLQTITGRPIQALMNVAFPRPEVESSSVIVSLMDISRLKQAESGLTERVKELRCLYRVLELTTDDELDIDAVCGEIVAILPQSLLHESVAVARLVLDGREFVSPGWTASQVELARPIRVDGADVGRVEIGYRARRPDQGAGHGPFLEEERALVAATAVHVGRMVADRRRADTLRQAERLSAVGELTGGIAHDFNNLLTVILGNAEILAERLSADPELNEIAATIQSASERGAQLTSRLLAFARRQPLDPQPADVNAQLTGMQALLRRSLGEHIEVRLALGEDLWPALVDAVQLESAVLNLCINSRDAMSSGGRLTIETSNATLDADYSERYPDVASGDYVMVAVSDTGSGMAAATALRAFDPFFTTKEARKGSGLGLSMVYGFVKQSNGHVNIYSELGAGTVVRLYLPRADAAADVVVMTQQNDATGGSESILLVEDNDLVRKHVAAQLTALGYDTIAARDGHEAIELLESDRRIDLLFTDVVMPGGIDGRALADRALELRPGLPVLFSSGYTEDGIVEQGRLEPGVNLLQKPYRRQDLAAKLRLVLDAQLPQ